MISSFNESEFSYAMKLFESDPFTCRERMEEYLEKYHFDYYARAYYVILLAYICEFDLAKEEYDRIIDDVKNNNVIHYLGNKPKSLSAFKYNMVIGKLKILGGYEKYKELYDFLFKNFSYLTIDEQNFLSYYCEFKLGILDPLKNHSKSYRFNQIINYSEDRFLEHIDSHLENDDNNSAIFKNDFPLDDIIQEVKKNIPSNKRLFRGYLDDTYCFKYDNCGSVNNKQTNYFKVVCYHNTCNFITMHPATNCEHLPCVDLNYMKELNDNVKVKKISQVDKFYKRYNR